MTTDYRENYWYMTTEKTTDMWLQTTEKTTDILLQRKLLIYDYRLQRKLLIYDYILQRNLLTITAVAGKTAVVTLVFRCPDRCNTIWIWTTKYFCAKIMSSSTIMLSEASVTQAEMTSPWTAVPDDVNRSASSVADNCVIFDVNATIPWNNPHNLISRETEFLFDRIKFTILIPALFLIGFPANWINMAVFFKQGLKERINFCLFSLALIDLACLIVVIVFYAERIYLQFTYSEDRIGAVYRYLIDNNMGGLFGVAYGPMFLSAIISTERCICVLFPLRAQSCVSPKAMRFIIVAGLSVLVLTRFAVSAMYQVTCFYEVRTQRVSWQLYVNDYYFRNKTLISVLNGVFYGFLLTVGCPVIVLIATTITAVRLTTTVRWRSQTSSSLSSKEIGVTKMLIALSIEFFVLSIPIICLRVFPVFEPRLRAGGELGNSFKFLVGLAEFSAYMSSSVNFFVYYFTGTRYRDTLRRLFSGGNMPPIKNIGNWKCGSTATKTTHSQASVGETSAVGCNG